MSNQFRHDFEGFLTNLSVNEPRTTRLMARTRQINDAINEEAPNEQEFNAEGNDNGNNDDESVDESGNQKQVKVVKMERRRLSMT